LIEVDHAQCAGLFDFPGGRLQIATQEAEERVLPLPLGPTRPTPHAGGDLEVQVRKKSPAGEFVARVLERDETFRLAIAAVKSNFGGNGASARVQAGEFADHFVSFVDASFGFSGAGFGTTAEPFEFGVDAILKGFLVFLLRVKIISLASRNLL